MMTPLLLAIKSQVFETFDAFSFTSIVKSAHSVLSHVVSHRTIGRITVIDPPALTSIELFLIVTVLQDTVCPMLFVRPFT